MRKQQKEEKVQILGALPILEKMLIVLGISLTMISAGFFRLSLLHGHMYTPH